MADDFQTRAAMRRKPQKTIKESERHPDAPVFSLTLKGGPNLSLGQDYRLLITITYHGPSFDTTTTNPDNDKPITIFHDIWEELVFGDRFSFIHRSSRGLEEMNQDPGCAGFLLDWTDGNPPEYLTVGDFPGGENKNVAMNTLLPGQSWEIETSLGDVTFYEREGFQVGEKYIYRYNGGEISWWNWGTKEDLKNEQFARVDSTSKGVFTTYFDKGRPKIVIPASNDLEFSVVE